MNQLLMTNTTLLKHLSNITKTVFEDPEVVDKLSKRAIRDTDENITDCLPYSDEYLYRALEYPVTDYNVPKAGYGLDTVYAVRKGGSYWHELASPLIRPLMSYIGSHMNALCNFYPNNGYIGWHHNGNAHGFNFLLTYSIDGEGYFRYYDKRTDTFTTLNDNPGWNFRFGYYSSLEKDHDDLFWHTAYTKNPRITLGFIVPNKTVWKTLIEECADEIPFDLDAIGPKD